MKKLCTLLMISMLSTAIQAQIWTQFGADIDGEAIDDHSGCSVSLSADGSTVAIGAYNNDGNGMNAGQVRVYSLKFSVWSQLGEDIDGEAAGDYSGSSLSLSNDGLTVAIGAFLNDGSGSDAGHVRVYSFLLDGWTQLGADIDGETDYDWSGRSVSLSADGLTVAIGAHNNAGNGLYAGHVRIYRLISGVWTQLGVDIDGEAINDYSGWSVSMNDDGSTVAIGAYTNDGNGSNAGHVRVYNLISGTWTQFGTDIDGEAVDDRSGNSVSLSADGLTVAIGAFYNDGSGSAAGHVRVYNLISGTWTQLGSDIDGEAADDQSGYSVSLSADGARVAIGALENDANGPGAGHVRAYSLVSGVWTQLAADIDGEAVSDFSGRSVSLSADGLSVAIGADGNAGNGSDAGHVRVYSICSSTLDLSENDFSADLTLYPNPTSGKISISLGQMYINVNVKVSNVLGQIVFSRNFSTTDKLVFEIEGEAGLYFIDITTAEGKSAKLKAIKK